MKTKRMTCRAFVKSVNEETREVEQIVSVFGNVDLGKDRVNLGAFKGSLDRWAESGDPIPAIWSHSWDDPYAHIGEVVEAKELAPGDDLLPDEIKELGGLYTRYKVDELPFADQVFHLLKNRRVREASFAYDVLKEKKGPDGANDLLELDLIEVGPTLKGMNPLTQLLSRKALADVGIDTKATSHTFIPKDDDPTRCVLCDLTRNTVGHLNSLSTVAGGTKAVVTLAGSAEDVQYQAWRAAEEWARENNLGDGGLYGVFLEATFPTENPVRVVFRVEGWNDPIGEGAFYEARFAVDDGGELVIDGDPVEVTIEGVVTPKSRRKSIDAIGRSDGSSARMMKSDTVAGHDGTPKGKGQGGDAEDLEDPEGGTSDLGAPSRALLELELLELS